ncbi:MAG: PAS domain S-box protein, partial [Negativicutes bacterium]|nr:PAS domain S-box protein [Negativicutes bacterium]
MDKRAKKSECVCATEAKGEGEECFHLLFEHAPIGMVIVDLSGRFQRVNQAMCDLVGYTPEEFCRLNFRDITHPDDLPKDLAMVTKLLAGDIPRFVLEKRYIRKDGQAIYVMLHVALRRQSNGDPAYFIGQIVDITERKRYEEAIKHMAYHDPLTGLPNRMLFRDKLIIAMAHARTCGSCLAVVFLDLDRFKEINDTLGHYMGDQALKLIADRLAGAVRKSDLVAAVRAGARGYLLKSMESQDVLDAVRR